MGLRPCAGTRRDSKLEGPFLFSFGCDGNRCHPAANRWVASKKDELQDPSFGLILL